MFFGSRIRLLYGTRVARAGRATDVVRAVLRASAACSALVAFAGSAPAQQPPAGSGGASASITITDDLGRRLAFDEPPCRIVSLIPAATEIVFALGAEECLVGRSTWDDHPAAVTAIPDVGRAIGADVERVVARRPDLVLLVSGSDNARTVDDFERLGVPSVVFAMNRLPELRSTVERLGRLLQRDGRADSLWSAIEDDLRDVRERTSGLERPVTYYDVAHPPPITIGRGSYLDSLITIAGGRNAFHDVEAPSPTISLEAIAVRDPDLILFPVGDGWDGASHPADRPLWSSLRAVRAGNVRRVDADLLHRLGPRVGKAVRELARVIHPEAFEDEERPGASGAGVAGGDGAAGGGGDAP